LNKDYRKGQDYCQQALDNCLKLYKKRTENYHKNNEKGSKNLNILDILINYNIKCIEEGRKGDEFTDQEAVHTIASLMFAAFDTTKNTSSIA